VPVAKHEKTAHQFTMYARADEVPADRRSAMLAQCDEILGASWHMTGPVWAGRQSVFGENLRDRTRALRRRARGVLDLPTTHGRRQPSPVSRRHPFLPAHQDRGWYSRLRTSSFRPNCTRPNSVEGPPTHYAWRTRNPIVWATNARYAVALFRACWMARSTLGWSSLPGGSQTSCPHNALEVPHRSCRTRTARWGCVQGPTQAPRPTDRCALRR